MRKSLLQFLLLFSVCISQAQQSDHTQLDSLVQMAVSLSEEALFDVRLEEAKQIVAFSYFKHFSGIQPKHEVILTLQEMRVERFMNIVYNLSSDPNQQFNRLQALAPVVDQMKKDQVRGNFLLAFSSVYRSLGKKDSALLLENEALAIFKENKEFGTVANIQATQISRTHNQLLQAGEKEKIRAMIPRYKQEIRFSQQHSKYALSYNTRHLAQIHRRQTLNYKEALALFEQSLALREEIGFSPFLPASYSSIGDVYMKMGADSMAIHMYHHAAALALDIGFVRYQSSPYERIGDILLAQGKKEESLSYYLMALSLASRNKYDAGVDSAMEKMLE